MPVSVVILAAGQGKRMNSALPKVLQPLAGRPMLAHVLASARALEPAAIHVVYGHGGDAVKAAFPDADVQWALQAKQLGTGHAVGQALPSIPDGHQVLVLLGDVPLVTKRTLQRLVKDSAAGELALLTAVVEEPTGYGRVIRDEHGAVCRIVEEKDATDDERRVNEINTGLIAFEAGALRRYLARLDNDNAQGEYYLTDVVSVLAEMGHRIGCVQAPADETQGVNDRWQLALAERELRSRTNRHWLLSGVTMLDPRQTFIDVTVRIGRDVTLYPGTMLQGSTVVGDECEVGPDTRLVDCSVGDGATVAHTVGTDAEVGQGAVVGPYAHLPAGSSVPEAATTGAFYTAPIG